MDILAALNETLQTLAVLLISGCFFYLIIKVKEPPIEQTKHVKRPNMTRPNKAKSRPFSYSDSELADIEEQER